MLSKGNYITQITDFKACNVKKKKDEYSDFGRE
jgi:hypothetical protein